MKKEETKPVTKKESKPKKVGGEAKADKKPAAKPKKKEKENTAESDEDDPLHIFESIEHATEGGKKRLSIERIYQKKSQLEHILLRPDTYIGSVESLTQVTIAQNTFYRVISINRVATQVWQVW